MPLDCWSTNRTTKRRIGRKKKKANDEGDEMNLKVGVIMMMTAMIGVDRNKREKEESCAEKGEESEVQVSNRERVCRSELIQQGSASHLPVAE
jgi:hypothetical protein